VSVDPHVYGRVRAGLPVARPCVWACAWSNRHARPSAWQRRRLAKLDRQLALLHSCTRLSIHRRQHQCMSCPFTHTCVCDGAVWRPRSALLAWVAPRLFAKRRTWLWPLLLIGCEEARMVRAKHTHTDRHAHAHTHIHMRVGLAWRAVGWRPRPLVTPSPTAHPHGRATATHTHTHTHTHLHTHRRTPTRACRVVSNPAVCSGGRGGVPGLRRPHPLPALPRRGALATARHASWTAYAGKSMAL
jgi:hypothetical protein